jgi:hypothetical protein
MSLGTNSLIRILSGAIGPALAGMYMQTNQSSIVIITGQAASFPTASAYN